MTHMDDKQKRIDAYPNVDGTLELMLGVSLFLISLVPVFLRFSVNPEIFLSLLPIVILGFFFGLIWFKQRVTRPRTTAQNEYIYHSLARALVL